MYFKLKQRSLTAIAVLFQVEAKIVDTRRSFFEWKKIFGAIAVLFQVKTKIFGPIAVLFQVETKIRRLKVK